MTEASENRVLLVGLDAACDAVLDPLLEDGRLPTIGSVLADGVRGRLESQFPPWTPSAWPSLFTGTNPGKHGAYGFLSFDGYDWDVVNRTRVRQHALWELLDHHGLSSVVVNVPVTHPPRPFDGALIPGYTAPEDASGHPDGVLDDVEAELGPYSVYGEHHDDPADARAEYEHLVESRGDAFCHLVERVDPDFGFLQFQQTDTVFHEHPGGEELVAAVYEAVDEQVGRAIDAFDPDTVVLASDHGIGPYTGSELRVNDFLAERGHAETTNEGDAPSWSELSRTRLRGEGDDGPSTLARAVGALSAVGVTSQRLGSALDRLGLADLALRVAPSDAVRAGAEHVDFSESAAFMRSRVECGVRLNVAGREPDGVVDPDEYEAVRADVIDELAALRLPDGGPVFDRVLPREAVFDGPYVEDAPDVVLVPANWNQFLSASIHGERFGDPSEPYNHKPHGVVAAAGDGVTASADPGGAHLLDVAPTVLAAFGLPVADHMDGSVLPGFDHPGTDTYPAFDAADAAATDDARVEEHLSNLGYLE
ncbi:alkaline phosphatase family protein [Halobacterium zhouii]|uniref:alkaline phosphatase family protein n=1 Tax=Halobacterium zhouii TaxID=2902624 RepID=UPI001E5DF8CA|nr:alkaline phosphatase family protein [Halobacterium zhouii]